jgi:hypothetical protein
VKSRGIRVIKPQAYAPQMAAAIDSFNGYIQTKVRQLMRGLPENLWPFAVVDFNSALLSDTEKPRTTEHPTPHYRIF